jgi:DNA gyrase/topoisomerase IV subunit A
LQRIQLRNLGNGYYEIDIYYSEKDVDVLMISDEGKGIIFNSSNFNAVGSTNSQGNCGMKLNEGNKIISAIIDINKEFNFELETLKGKNKSFMLSDIAPTNKINEERDLYTYLFSRRGNQGNFLINTRTNEDKIISLIIK